MERKKLRKKILLLTCASATFRKKNCASAHVERHMGDRYRVTCYERYIGFVICDIYHPREQLQTCARTNRVGLVSWRSYA